MKKYLAVLVTALILLSLSACRENQPSTSLSATSSTPRANLEQTDPSWEQTAPSTVPTEPEDNDPGHDFSADPDICSHCGLDYFSATLEFALADTRDYYILMGPGTCTRTEIVVPASYQGKPVMKIADGAFKRDYYDPIRINCDKITSITLPESITEIGEAAFQDCWSLSYINLPSGLTEISPYVFYCCFVLRSVDIPDGVTVIGERAFMSCQEGLENVSLPNGLESIEKLAFSGCAVLKEIDIPETVTSIGEGAFSSCRALESIALPQAVEELPYELFYNCVSLKTIEFGDNVRRIGRSALAGCSFETLILPASVKYIEYSAFAGCRYLRTLYIPSGLEEIQEDSIFNCNSLEFNVCDGVYYLGNPEEPYMLMVVVQDDGLTELTVHPDTRFIISKNVRSDSTKEYLCQNLESLYIGKGVKYIEHGVFTGSVPLASIRVDEENPYFHDQNNCLIETETKTLVLGCKTSVIPDDGSVTVIGVQAFRAVQEIRIIVIPDAVTEIGGNAFTHCPDLEALVIGSGVQFIDNDIGIGSEKLNIVYYHGTQSQWEQIQIVGINVSYGFFGDNIELKNATKYFYSETKPTEPGNYWHYVDGVPTPWEAKE